MFDFGMFLGYGINLLTMLCHCWYDAYCLVLKVFSCSIFLKMEQIRIIFVICYSYIRIICLVASFILNVYC